MRTEVPCAPCQRLGGYRVSQGGTLWPPQPATAPYDGFSFVGEEEERRPAWNHEPMCAVHAHAYIEAEYASRSAERETRAKAEREKMRARTPRGGLAAQVGDVVREVLP